VRPAIAAAVLLAFAPAALAEDRATPKEAEAMVHKAIDYLKKEGKEKAFAVFNDPHGAFAYRDLYITAFDPSGICLANGAKKERVGKSLIEDKDVDGKLFVKERLELARKDGKGWQQYKFMNPATKAVELKVVYFEQAGDVIIGSGAYKP
jgi:cytochrome c